MIAAEQGQSYRDPVRSNMCFVCHTGAAYLSLAATQPCGHIVHEICFHRYQINAILNSEPLECPQCLRQIPRISVLTLGIPATPKPTVVPRRKTIEAIYGRHLWTLSPTMTKKYLDIELGRLFAMAGDATLVLAEIQERLRQGAVVALIRCLQRFSDDVSICLKVLQLLEAFVAYVPSIRILLFIDSAMDVIFESATRHADDENTVYYLSNIFDSLLNNAPDNGKDKVENTAVSAMLTILKSAVLSARRQFSRCVLGGRRQ